MKTVSVANFSCVVCWPIFCVFNLLHAAPLEFLRTASIPAGMVVQIVDNAGTDDHCGRQQFIHQLRSAEGLLVVADYQRMQSGVDANITDLIRVHRPQLLADASHRLFVILNKVFALFCCH